METFKTSSPTMDTPGIQSIRRPEAIFAIVAAIAISYFISQLVHRLFFHPLRKIPGPWYNVLFRIGHISHLLSGTTATEVTRLHEKYGAVIRPSPNEVSFISGETAW